MAYNSDASVSWTTIGKKGRHSWISPSIQSESLSCYNTISKAGSFVDDRNVYRSSHGCKVHDQGASRFSCLIRAASSRGKEYCAFPHRRQEASELHAIHGLTPLKILMLSPSQHSNLKGSALKPQKISKENAEWKTLISKGQIYHCI